MSGINQKDNNVFTGGLTEAKAELKKWKTIVDQEDDAKARLTLQKLEEDQVKKKTKDEMISLNQSWDLAKREFDCSSKSLQDEVVQLGRRRVELMEKLKRCKTQLETKRSESIKLQQRFKILARIPDMDVEFIRQAPDDAPSSDEPIRGRFRVSQQGALLLKGGQALITFEEEKVVSQILKMDKCSVSLDDGSLEVTPKRIRTDPSVDFQVHLHVSRTQVDVSEVVSLMPATRVRDRLELGFSKPSRGGAEVRTVDFDESSGTGRITFKKPGVAETLVLSGEHPVDLDFEVNVKVSPVCEHQLQKFQSFCGAPKRTVLLDHIRDTGDEDEVQDQLEIHFQKPSNGGGEIESTKYISNGKSLLAYFCSDA